jgi:hypothetical protein
VFLFYFYFHKNYISFTPLIREDTSYPAETEATKDLQNLIIPATAAIFSDDFQKGMRRDRMREIILYFFQQFSLLFVKEDTMKIAIPKVISQI